MKQNQKNCLLRIVTLVLLCCSVGFASVARAQNVQLHERVTSDSSSTNHSCVRPASYTYQDTFGEVDCIPVERGNCDFVTICRYHRTSGCFPPEAKILMADRSTVKKVVDLQTGDKIWNPVQKKVVEVGRLLSGPEKNALFEFAFGSVKIHVTEKHPMVVQGVDGKPFVKAAHTVVASDLLLGNDGQFHKIDVLKKLPVQEGQMVYNFEVVSQSQDQNDRMVSADGVVTGDVVVQTRLSGGKLPWEK